MKNTYDVCVSKTRIDLIRNNKLIGYIRNGVAHFYLPAILFVLMLAVGCSTLNKAVVTVTSVVDVAMTDWAKASVAGKTTPELDAKVKAAHAEYRRVCGQLVPIYESAIAAGDTPKAADVLKSLRSAVDPLMDLILPLVTTTEAQTLTKNLNQASKP